MNRVQEASIQIEVPKASLLCVERHVQTLPAFHNGSLRAIPPPRVVPQIGNSPFEYIKCG